MKLHKKIKSWFLDYVYMVQGGLLMTVHRNPPKHYLEYTIEGKVPIILIPGILGKWGFMKHLGDQISLAGHPVYIVPELKYNIHSIPSSAQKLKTIIMHIFPKLGHVLPEISSGAEHIKKLLRKENIKGAVLVAHSKGGLIGKYFLAHYNDDHRIIGMIAVATPFSGSAMAKLVPHKAFKELRTDSQIIQDLEKYAEINKEIISIIPEYDNHIWSEHGSFLTGAENIEVSAHGHHKVLFSKEVSKIVLESIEKLQRKLLETVEK